MQLFAGNFLTTLPGFPDIANDNITGRFYRNKVSVAILSLRAFINDSAVFISYLSADFACI